MKCLWLDESGAVEATGGRERLHQTLLELFECDGDVVRGERDGKEVIRSQRLRRLRISGQRIGEEST